MEINIVFKTHFDYGYTDLSRKVEERYMKEYIPNALSMAEKFEESDTPFAWTTGAWLIERYLLTAGTSERQRMVRAIEKGQIFWHALPFTMHVEMMDAPLFERGLEVSRRLDRQFGRTTVAAKATDVPGMTRAAVPYLAKAGIKLLHVGVNPVSAVPEVPAVFCWRASDGSEVMVLYSSNYGELVELPGTDRMLYFSMTNDNVGPAGEDSVKNLYRMLREKYPEAVIRPISMNEAALALEKSKEYLPVVTSEIGDSWAHGYQSDPAKQSMFRSLLRFAREIPKTYADVLLDQILPVAEHTCGACGSKFLHDECNYDRKDFEKVRSGENYRICEESWEEQRAYLVDAVKNLPENYREKANMLLQETSVEYPDISGYESIALGNIENTNGLKDLGLKIELGRTIELGEFRIAVGYDGAITSLSRGERIYAAADYPLFTFEYELFSAADTERFMRQYSRDMRLWGVKDLGKTGMDTVKNGHILAGAAADALYKKGNTLICLMHCEKTLTETYGCPGKLMLKLTAEEEKLFVDFAWWEKPASRIPEAMWLRVGNPGSGIAVRKLNEWIDPRDVVRNGGRALHGTDYGIRLGDMTIETLDCALVTFGNGLWEFNNRIPGDDSDARFNLYNNMWNTNFPMWYSENARFRFCIK